MYQDGIAQYDGFGKMTAMKVGETRTGGSFAGTTSYEYDSLGQLTRVNDPVEGATWVYSYGQQLYQACKLGAGKRSG